MKSTVRFALVSAVLIAVAPAAMQAHFKLLELRRGSSKTTVAIRRRQDRAAAPTPTMASPATSSARRSVARDCT